MIEMLALTFSVLGAFPVIWGLLVFLRRGLRSKIWRASSIKGVELGDSPYATVAHFLLNQKVKAALSHYFESFPGLAQATAIIVEERVGPSSTSYVGLRLIKDGADLGVLVMHGGSETFQEIMSILKRSGNTSKGFADIFRNIDVKSDVLLPKFLGLLSNLASEDGFSGLPEELDDYLEMGYKRKSLLEISKVRFVLWQSISLSISISKDNLRILFKRVAMSRRTSK